MDNLYQKSQNTLELSRVLEILAEHAVSESAKELARSLTPKTDVEEVRAAITKTSDARRLIGIKGAPSFSGIRNLSASVKRAERGGALNAAELLYVADLLKCARGAQSYLEDDRKGEKKSDLQF